MTAAKNAEQWVFPDSTLVRVKDGDTFVALVTRTLDAGFHQTVTCSSVQSFRLNRCAAAPLHTASGAAAAAAFRELLEPHDQPLVPFTLTSVGPYKYGDEWMAEVLLADGRNVSDLLIAEQWAAPWLGAGPQPLPPWPRTVS